MQNRWRESCMAEQTKTEQAIKTILRFLGTYIVRHAPFTAEMYQKEGCSVPSEEDLKKLNTSYANYLNGEGSFCKKLINDVGQSYALRKGRREDTGSVGDPLYPGERDFLEFCRASDTLQIVSGYMKSSSVDFIVVPGALQRGVEKRISVVSDYLQKNPKFRGQILLFGTRDRKLYPFMPSGEIREKMTFDILAESLNKVQGLSTYTAESLQKLLHSQYQDIQAQSGLLKETEIADKLALKWETETGVKWPTEYQMVCRLANQRLQMYPVQTIETFKKTNDSTSKRATTADEAVYIADRIQKLTQEKQQQDMMFVPHIAIVTNYAYQVETYRGEISQYVKDAEISMLSPYKNTQDFLENWKTRDWLQGKTNAELDSLFTVEVLDAFARLIYSQKPKCYFNEAVKVWRQKNRCRE